MSYTCSYPSQHSVSRDTEGLLNTRLSASLHSRHSLYCVEHPLCARCPAGASPAIASHPSDVFESGHVTPISQVRKQRSGKVTSFTLEHRLKKREMENMGQALMPAEPMPLSFQPRPPSPACQSAPRKNPSVIHDPAFLSQPPKTPISCPPPA